jgi:hypothetical protein
MDLPFVTNAAFIDLKEFQAFLSHAQATHPECDTLQINFIRYDIEWPESWVREAGEQLSQVSLQFFPVKAVDNAGWVVDGPQTSRVVSFRVCPPGANYKEGVSGICPPKGNCSDQEIS